MWLGQPARASDVPSWCNDSKISLGQSLTSEDAMLTDYRSFKSADPSVQGLQAKYLVQQVKDSENATLLRLGCAAQTSGATRTWHRLHAAMDEMAASAAYSQVAMLVTPADSFSKKDALRMAVALRSQAQDIFKKITRTYGSDQIKMYNGLHAMLFGS